MKTKVLALLAVLAIATGAQAAVEIDFPELQFTEGTGVVQVAVPISTDAADVLGAMSLGGRRGRLGCRPCLWRRELCWNHLGYGPWLS